jgi:hypothetical protein
MAGPDNERAVIDYASRATPTPERAGAGLTVGQFGCAIVAVLYGIPVAVFLVLVLIALAERD